MTEVHEQAEVAASCTEIVQELRAMFIGHGRNGFDFDNDFAVTNEIGRECLNKRTAAILEGLRWFREKGNVLQLKFDFQAFVIDRFEKTASLLFVNGKARADDGVAFVFVN